MWKKFAIPLFAILFAIPVFADDPVFFPDGAKTAFVSNITTGATSVAVSQSCWLLGFEYRAVLNNPSTAKLIDSATDTNVAALTAKWNINDATNQSTVWFKTPIFFRNGVVCRDVKGMYLNLLYITEANRRRLPY